jgi:adenosine deaminase
MEFDSFDRTETPKAKGVPIPFFFCDVLVKGFNVHVIAFELWEKRRFSQNNFWLPLFSPPQKKYSCRNVVTSLRRYLKNSFWLPLFPPPRKKFRTNGGSVQGMKEM